MTAGPAAGAASEARAAVGPAPTTAIAGPAAGAASEAPVVVARVATMAIADPVADVGSETGPAAADPEVTAGPAADAVDRETTNRVNERARDESCGPARLN